MVDGAGGAADEDVEWGGGCGWRGRRGEAGGFEDCLQLAGADDRVDLGDVAANLVAVALDQASGDDEALGFAAIFALVPGHLEDGVDGLLLGGVDEAAGVDDEDLGVLGAGSELAAGAVKQAHHDFGVDQVLGAAEGDEADLWAGESSRPDK